MARIRTIKPEFWSDYRLSRELSRDERLFYIGLWNQADDDGRFPAHPRRLLGAIFPYESDLTEVWVSDSLRKLVDTGRLVLYSVGAEPYGQLLKFGPHQKINRPTPSKLPSPPKDSVDSLSTHGGFTGPIVEASRQEQGTGKGKEQGVILARAREEDSPEALAMVGPDGSGFVHPARRVSASQLLHAWEYRQSRRLGDVERAKHLRVARTLADGHSAEELLLAFVGMDGLYPYSKGEPWDLADLRNKFHKAMSRAKDHPELRSRQREAELLQMLEAM